MSAREADAVHEVLRIARREKGISQSELADQVGCKQSAISMFEGGKPDALAREKVLAIAEKLGVDIKSLPTAPGGAAAEVSIVLKYCPVDSCPANVPYVVGNELCFEPTMVESPLDEITRCGFCGEVLEDCCPKKKCHARLEPGSFCTKCGTPYVTVVKNARVKGSLTEWADKQRARIREIRSMSETVKYDYGRR